MPNNASSKIVTFSLLMANYNNENYIEVAIRSVISQTYPNWELIIVDDNSSDNSLQLIHKYLEDNRIKVITHNRNLGYAGALKTAASSARNEIICVLDADDKLALNALETVAEAYRNNPDIGFIYTNMWECDSKLENCRICDWIGPTEPQKSNIFNVKISHFKTFKTEAYINTSGFDPNQKKAVDKDIIFKLEEVTKLKYIDQPLYYYRWHGKGISQTKTAYIPELYNYRAKLKAYQRRLNTSIPNLTKSQIYFEYYRITFFKLSHFLIKIYRKLGIKHILTIASLRFPIFADIVKKKLFFLKRLN